MSVPSFTLTSVISILALSLQLTFPSGSSRRSLPGRLLQHYEEEREGGGMVGTDVGI